MQSIDSCKVRKKGDAQRILLMNMVKVWESSVLTIPIFWQEGNLTIEEAMKHAQGMGVDVGGARPTFESAYKAHEGKIYNFG